MQHRVLYITHRYPQVTQTYIENERDVVARDHVTHLVCFNNAYIPAITTNSYDVISRDDTSRLFEIIDKFKPTVIHAHWLFVADKAFEAAQYAGIPFTIRAHSFDVLSKDQTLERTAKYINSSLCKGILTFPFTRDILENKGFESDKIYECQPVLNFKRFFDDSPNGSSIMGVSVFKDKKNIDDFIRLSVLSSDTEFNLYCPGIKNADKSYIEETKKHCNLMPLYQNTEMPFEYKKHKYLIYTASKQMNTVGWPVAVAEAQASGVIVCMQNIRNDLSDYLGGSGILFEDVSELVDVVNKDNSHLRELGFENAKNSDIDKHISILYKLWSFNVSSSVITKHPNGQVVKCGISVKSN